MYAVTGRSAARLHRQPDVEQHRHTTTTELTKLQDGGRSDRLLHVLEIAFREHPPIVANRDISPYLNTAGLIEKMKIYQLAEMFRFQKKAMPRFTRGAGNHETAPFKVDRLALAFPHCKLSYATDVLYPMEDISLLTLIVAADSAAGGHRHSTWQDDEEGYGDWRPSPAHAATDAGRTAVVFAWTC